MAIKLVFHYLILNHVGSISLVKTIFQSSFPIDQVLII